MKLKTLKSPLQTMTLRAAAPMPVVERKRGSTGVKDRANIKFRDQYMCQQCKAEGRTILGDVVDHRTPLWEGGSDEDNNKWLLCNRCHDAKTATEAGRRAGR